MYHYVTDKEFLKQSYSICADLVNQLVQELKGYEIDSEMHTVGSKKRGLITQNENEPIDYDFNLLIHNPDAVGSPGDLKKQIMEAFNDVLERNGLRNCDDSTSAITTKRMQMKKGNKTEFSIDVCIVRIDRYGKCQRLIHQKHQWIQYGQYYWNDVCNQEDLWEKEDYLKPDYWQLVREKYLDRKNFYLRRGDYDHPSFVCYIESVNDIYNQVKMQTQSIKGGQMFSIW